MNGKETEIPIEQLLDIMRAYLKGLNKAIQYLDKLMKSTGE